ncbi:MAG: DMT family transporter [Chlamydiales bacterium]|nr:DMT family transporter [Chlamydiales bacterium]
MSFQDFYSGAIMLGMLRGILFAVAACFVWGFIFVIPNWLLSFTPVEVVLGRYITYGIFSIILLLRKGWKIPLQFPPKAWLTALLFALCSNIFYYFGVVWGLRYASAPLTVLIVGLAPIVIALYGNWHVREISFKHLILPCAWIASGVILVNVQQFEGALTTGEFKEYVVGLFGIFVALAGWSVYVVHNARFLKKNSQLPVTEWASVIGTATLFLSLTIAAFFFFIAKREVEIAHFDHFSKSLLGFILGVSTLGVASSWGGCYLWNRASTFLPVSLLGPMMILETVFGLLFVYLAEFHFPSWVETIGILMLISGMLYALHVFKTRKFTHS